MGPRKIQDTGISPSTALNLARVLVSSDMTKKYCEVLYDTYSWEMASPHSLSMFTCVLVVIWVSRPQGPPSYITGRFSKVIEKVVVM